MVLKVGEDTVHAVYGERHNGAAGAVRIEYQTGKRNKQSTVRTASHVQRGKPVRATAPGCTSRSRPLSGAFE